jgi:hypothetical protein
MTLYQTVTMQKSKIRTPQDYAVHQVVYSTDAGPNNGEQMAENQRQ